MHTFPVFVFGNWVNVIYLYYGAGVDLYRKIPAGCRAPGYFFETDGTGLK
ncbi:MAG: hypothetical protein IPL53_09555 [Ignavibacteria bacterium]|nr:hypothetical protein [Ignavibacteria bacterium]